MKYKDVCLTKSEEIEVEKWILNHSKKHPDCEGTIGGRFSINFTLTSIGAMVSVRCSCGQNNYIHRDL